MAKIVVGYIFSGKKYGRDEKLFMKLAKEKGMELIMFDALSDLDHTDTLDKIKKCDIFYKNNSEYDSVLEFAKTIEQMGKQIIDATESCYYAEDKWLFYLECRKHKIATPETILLSKDLHIARGELHRFNHWPIVLKRVFGCQGEYVGRAENITDALKIVEDFWKKGNEKLPIIAQEFIKSKNYRVLTIGQEIAQTVLKKSKGWKATGAWAWRHSRFKTDKELESIIKKLVKMTGIRILGTDLLKKDGRWVVLEVNSEPTFGFIEADRAVLVSKTLDLLNEIAKTKTSCKRKSSLAVQAPSSPISK